MLRFSDGGVLEKKTRNHLIKYVKIETKNDSAKNRACEQTLADSYLHRTVNCLSKVQSGAHG